MILFIKYLVFLAGDIFRIENIGQPGKLSAKMETEGR